MSHWIRFEHLGKEGFGTLNDDVIHVHTGSMMGESSATEEQIDLREVTVLPPTEPTKMVGLWNNFHERAKKEGLTKPAHPLYFIKASGSFLASDQTIRQPDSYDGPVAFEGELGVVIGKKCKGIKKEEAADYIFGYTCVNDATARGIMREDPSFVQWTRAKSFDTFGAFGPVVAEGIDPTNLRIKTRVDKDEKQNYAVSDMFYQPAEIVALLSQDMTLFPGDIIACGTSVGADPMPKGSQVEVVIEGIGALSNRFE